MAETDKVRDWYHETVSNHARRGSPGYSPVCNWDIAKVVRFPKEGGGFYSEPVHPATVEAWTAYIILMDTYGETMPSAGGVNQCRNIKGTDWPSLHAYLVAVDLPPNSRKSDRFIQAVEAVRTVSGARVFRNLPGDRMHDQIDCSQEDLRTGIDWLTVRGDIVPAHPYDSHQSFVEDHTIGEIPDWSPWDEYVAAGGTTRPESGIWPFTRADMAWVWKRFIFPLEQKVKQLEAGSGGITEDRVKALIRQHASNPDAHHE